MLVFATEADLMAYIRLTKDSNSCMSLDAQRKTGALSQLQSVTQIDSDETSEDRHDILFYVDKYYRWTYPHVVIGMCYVRQVARSRLWPTGRISSKRTTVAHRTRSWRIWTTGASVGPFLVTHTASSLALTLLLLSTTHPPHHAKGEAIQAVSHVLARGAGAGGLTGTVTLDYGVWGLWSLP